MKKGREVENLYDRYKTYLVGAMENTAEKDCGKGWREIIKPQLEVRDVFVFDPTKEEASKVGMSIREFHDKLVGWKQSGNWDLYVKNMDKIWRGITYSTEDGVLKRIMGDADYVMHSDFLIVHLNPKDLPCGTYGEVYHAWLLGTPVYLVTEINKTDLNGSLIYWVLASGGDVFKNFFQLLEHLDHVYKLKSKKVKQGVS